MREDLNKNRFVYGDTIDIDPSAAGQSQAAMPLECGADMTLDTVKNAALGGEMRGERVRAACAEATAPIAHGLRA